MMTQTMTSNHDDAIDITDEQIEALRAEAAAAGDMVQVAICDVALASGLADVAEIPHETRAPLEAIGIIPEHVDADVRARGECARVIEAELSR